MNSSARRVMIFCWLWSTIVLPAEADLAVFQVEQAVIGDGDTVREATDVVQHLCGSREGPLGVDDPFDLPDGSQVAQEGAPLSQRLQRGEELQFASVKGFLEILQKETTKQAAQHPDGQEEPAPAGDPAAAVR